MSLRPGIGMKVVPRIVTALRRFPQINPLDVTETRALGAKYPLGRYLRGKLLDSMGTSQQERQAHVQTLNARKFSEFAESGTTAYYDQRKARVRAALGRRIERIKSL